MLYKISVSEYEKQDQHDIDIEIVPQDGLDPKWSKNLIEAAGNDVGDPDDRRRTRSQYQNEYVALSHIASLPIEWCNKIPKRCYLMMKIDPQFGP